MEDVFSADWQEDATSASRNIGAELATLVDRRGLAVLDEPAQIRLSLIEACPDAPEHVAALVAAARARVPQRLSHAVDDERLSGVLQASTRLAEERGPLDPAWAQWAVRVWAHALALPTDPPMAMRTAEPSRATTREGATPIETAATLDVEPLFTDEDVARIAGTPRGTVAPTSTEAPRPDPIVVPMDRVEPSSVTSEGRRLLPIAGALVATCVVVILFGLAIQRREPAATARPAAVEAPVAVAPVRVEPAAVEAPAAAPSVAAPSAITASTEATPVAAAPTEATPQATNETPIPAEPEPVAAVPAPAPPVIVRVETPRIVEGAPFAVSLQVAGDARDIVAVERTFGGSSGSWPRSGRVTTALQRLARDRVAVPFRAMDAPARTVVSFVAVARDGTRSAPQRAVLEVAGPGLPTGGPGSGAACTSSTCGTVVDAEQLGEDPATGITTYRVVVRLDDGRRLSSSATYRLQTGSRVQLVDGRFVPAR